MASGSSAAKGFFFGVLLMIVLGIGVVGGALADRLFVVKPLDYIASKIAPKNASKQPLAQMNQTVVNEESVVIDVAEKASPSVVTVSMTTTQSTSPMFFMDPFGMFGNMGMMNQNQQQQKEVKQDIGTGFVVDSTQGLIVTNKHVVESTGAKYKIITKDDKEYDVTNIYRDPANDLAILKVNATLPEAMVLGDSDKNKVGQFVIAIGTALGEFRHTVTTGVISGLGRGIEAGDGWGGSVEQLDNVIQTDAAINPGNSGGPLLNSAGQVIGVNVAVSQSGQNIGFALPINVVKSSLDNFNKTGQFNRPYLGVQYKVISKESALMNEVPEGAYVAGVVSGSPAETAGIKQGDIITKLGGKSVKDTEGGLVGIINQSKVGDTLDIEVFRDKKTQTLKVTLKSADQ
jgi:S1-C subfamily serine protease